MISLPILKEEAVLAREQLRSYRKLQRDKRTKEDLITMASLRALARGQNLISLGAAVAKAGLNADGLPRLAIAQADWKHVHFAYKYNNPQGFFGGHFAGEGGVPEGYVNRYIALPLSCFVSLGDRRPNAVALVPTIPPEHRPTGELNRYHILWEAVWHRNKPPEDPFLLQHVAGDFYAVLAQWDLTPLEQQVLTASRR